VFKFQKNASGREEKEVEWKGMEKDEQGKVSLPSLLFPSLLFPPSPQYSIILTFAGEGELKVIIRSEKEGIM
jgi:hypothetical protein